MNEQTVPFRKGDKVRYIGDNAHYGFEGNVRRLETLGGAVKVDTELQCPRTKRWIRRPIDPMNLEHLTGSEAA